MDNHVINQDDIFVSINSPNKNMLILGMITSNQFRLSDFAVLVQ